jgi:phosphotriesterase-related protein
MKMATIRTVLGDIPAEMAGLTYAHEHLILDSVLIARAFPHILLDSVDVTAAEVAHCRDAGARTMVDTMPCASGRGILALAEVSRRTSVNILAVTGLHHERYYGHAHWTMRIPVETLADLFALDIEVGVDAYDYTGPVVERTPHRAGVIKVASSGGALDAREQRLFDAAAIAALRTGAPILTHCEDGRGGDVQLEEFAHRGVDPDRIVLSHTDKHPDPGYHRELAASGAYLVYDQVLRTTDTDPAPTTTLIAMHVERGRADQILLGTDGARRTLWTEYGGTPGLAWLAAGLPPRLRAIGLSQDQVDALYVTNPGRAFALR